MKNLLVLFLMLFTLNNLKAQNGHLGLKGGLNIYNLQFKNQEATDYKAGFNIGLLSHIHVTKKFAIQPEVVYSQQGGIINIANNEYKTNLNYINVPVLAQYMFGKGYGLQAGPQIGFLVNSKVKESLRDTETNTTDYYKPADVSLALGFGYLSHSKIGVDLRWVFGLSNINKSNAGVSTYNNGAQLSLFYQFDHRGLR